MLLIDLYLISFVASLGISVVFCFWQFVGLSKFLVNVNLD